MEIPSKVLVYNRTLEMKSQPGTLIAINDIGFYEIVIVSQGRNHTVLCPIADTAIIFNDALPSISADFEVER
jgi:hypothetical protein